MLERLKGVPPTPLSHFRIFHEDALSVARMPQRKGLALTAGAAAREG